MKKKFYIKTILLLIFCMLLQTPFNYFVKTAKAASSPNILWAKAYGGEEGDDFKSLIQTEDGGCVILGHTGSDTGDFKGLRKGYYTDAFIMKIDKYGSIKWKSLFGGNKEDFFYSIAKDNNNDYIVAGSSYSTDGDLKGLNKGIEDAVLAKYSNSGTLLWKRIIGGSNYDFFTSVAVLNDGNYVAVGQTLSTDKDLSNLNIQRSDALIVKVSQNGEILWKKTFCGDIYEIFYSVCPTSDGGFIAVGSSNSDTYDMSGIKDCYYNQSYDAIIVKYDKDGNIQWKKILAGNNDEAFKYVISTKDGYVAIGETKSSDENFEGLSKGDTDGFIAKYDNYGNLIWNKTFGGSRYDCFNGLNTDNDGYIVFGRSYSNDKDMSSLSKGTSTAIMLKYDDNGNLIWKKSFGGSGINCFNHGYFYNDEYTAVGFSTSSDKDMSGISIGFGDAVLVKYGNSVNNLKLTGLKLNITNTTLRKGQKINLKASTLPVNIINKKILWSSSNSKVAKVDSSGCVTALSKGNTIIYAYMPNYGYKVYCKITVK
ncbi:Ig-like domain-containing protein [Caloramator sp. E03]|uniref:Ig-like domain-containing protein n=1 Tax=Caloramator sp. E03 TaxID=2576307 RepID=UPI0011103AFC|nr:Ig-like domain-containing protein [Caloramator sp. E03]QCX34161.1 Ig-like domain-containing protein [Caloramator sp. E03]